MAGANAGHGSRTDGSHLEPKRDAHVEGATVAAAMRVATDLAMSTRVSGYGSRMPINHFDKLFEVMKARLKTV